MLWLFAEEWFWMALAALLGTLLGWWLRGSRAASERAALEADLAAARRSADDAAASRTRLEGQLAESNKKIAAGTASLSSLTQQEADKDKVQDGEIARLKAELDACRSQHAAKDAELAKYRAAAAALNEKLPTFLTAPRGVPDDLKLIKGVGEKLNTLLTSLGIFHFRQIANWTDDEIAQVDAKMENFKGRIIRDEWLPQAKLLADGKHEEFEAKYGKMGENN
jgi:predicted flap endonuclease-1-like 5' DNA nuclease